MAEDLVPIDIPGVGKYWVGKEFFDWDHDQQQALLREIRDAASQGRYSYDAPAPTQRARAFAQGATLGAADELEAAVRAPFSDKPLPQIRQDIMKDVNRYREDYPASSFGWELGGAAATGAATAPFTGGASMTPTIGRMAATGAGVGAVEGFMSGEGSLVDRGYNAVKGAGAGMIFGPAGYYASKPITKAFDYLVDTATRRLGKRAGKAVSAEIQRYADDAGLSVDEVADRVANGELLAEMSATTRQAARNIRSQPGQGKEIISQAFERRGRDGALWKRATQTRQEALEGVQEGLTGNRQGNVYRQVKITDDAMREAEDRAYERAWSSSGPLRQETVDLMGDILRRDPEAAKEAAKVLRLRTGTNPYFKVDDAGDVIFTRYPTLKEAELMRRHLSNKSNMAWKNSDGEAGVAYGDLEKMLREAIDSESDALRQTRAKAASIRTNRKAFQEGQSVWSKSPDEIAVMFENMADDVKEAYRLGAMHALRRKGGQRGAGSLMGNLAGDSTNEGQILRIIMPKGDVGDKAIRQVGRAANTQAADNVIMRGTQTAETQAGMAQAAAGTAQEAASALTGDMGAAMRLVAKVSDKFSSTLNERQRAEVAKILVTENPDLIRRAMEDRGGLAALQKAVENITRRVSIGSGVAGSATAAGLLSE